MACVQYFSKYETIETHARGFLTLIISVMGRVSLKSIATALILLKFVEDCELTKSIVRRSQ